MESIIVKKKMLEEEDRVWVRGSFAFNWSWGWVFTTEAVIV